MTSSGLTFSQARERGKGIAIRCTSCGRVGIFRTVDFEVAFRPDDVVADRRFRCRVCGRPAEASIVDINRLGREELASWTPRSTGGADARRRARRSCGRSAFSPTTALARASPAWAAPTR